MSRSTCRPPARRRPEPLRSAADALRVITLAGNPQRHQIVLLLLNGQRVGHGCVVVEHTIDPSAVFDVARLAAECTDLLGLTAGCVLASIRPDGAADPADIDRWFELLDTLDDAGVELLDWFIVGPGSAWSMRDVTGCPPVWQQ